MNDLPPNHAANPAIALWLQSTRPAGRVAESGSINDHESSSLMKIPTTSILLLACALLAGCKTRSISNSGYREEQTYFGPRVAASDPAFVYRGELSEFDVLGVVRGEGASENEIQQALNNAKALTLHRDSSVLLIQSGAMFPDGAMESELKKYFRVAPFSGVPHASPQPSDGTIESADPESFSKSLRLAAARGGNEFILCYWGILESASENLVTKTVSWVPVVTWFVPDEKQHMRIRLKLALVDVRSGNWSVLSPEPFDDSHMSVSPRRGVVDQKQVESLKSKAYAATVNDLIGRYSDIQIASRNQASLAGAKP
jgi:hypothetical protein